MHSQEELIDTVNVWELRTYRWPFLRALFPRFVAEMELGRYLRRLLATRRWTALRVIPHDVNGRPSDHVFDVYGQPRSNGGAAS